MSLPGYPIRIVYVLNTAILMAITVLLYTLLSDHGVFGLPPVRLDVDIVFGLPVVKDEGSLLAFSLAAGEAFTILYLYGRRGIGVEDRLRDQVSVAIQGFPTVFQSTESASEAVLLLSRNIRDPPLGRMLLRAYLENVRGKPIDEAFDIVLRGVSTDVKFLLSSIPVAARSGGRVQEVMEIVMRYSVELARLRISLMTRLSPYKYILALANIVYAMVSGISLGLLRILQGQELGPFAIVIDIQLFTGFLVYSSVVIAVATSIIGGKVIWDKIPAGFILAAIFVPFNTFTIVFLPEIIAGFLRF